MAEMDMKKKLVGLLWRAWADAEEICSAVSCEDCPAGPKNAKCMTGLAASHLIAHGVTVLTGNEARNVYTVQEIEEIQNEAYDLGADSVLRHKFGLSWDDATELRMEIQRLQDATKWISVKERKPDLELVEAKGDDFDLYACLATIKNDRAKNGRYVGKAWYDGERFVDSDCMDITYNVTHWMPLPPAPKGE